jgi:surface glycoprotein (TIGR04207 family)/PGF-CTERM protein
MTGSSTKLRAVVLAAIMILSVPAGLVVMTGTAAAADTIVVDDDGTGDYTSIQTAIDDANAGDTIEVKAGTYDEDVTVNKKNLNLVGPNAGTPGYGSRVTEATITGQVVITASDVTFDGFDVSPPKPTTNPKGEALRVSNTPDNVVVRNNIVRDFDGTNLPDWEGAEGIIAFGGDSGDAIQSVTITRNLVTNIQGKDEKGGATGISIQGNVQGASVTENEVVNVGMNSTGWALGFVVRGTGNHNKVPASVQFTDNDIRQVYSNPATSTVGVGIGGGEKGAQVSEMTVTNNAVHDVELLVENKDTGNTLDVSNNWWGTDRGPNAPTNSLVTSAAGIGGSGEVDFEPWLDDRVEDGGQPTGAAQNVDTGTFYSSIQEAVNAASPGDTIEVKDYVLHESVTVDVSGLTLTAADGANPVIVGNGSGVGSQPHATIWVKDTSAHKAPNTTDVTIRGLTITNPKGHYGIYAGSGSGGANVSGLTVEGNTLADIATKQPSPSPLAGGVAGLHVRANYDGITVVDNTVVNVTSQDGTTPVGLSFSSFSQADTFSEDNYANGTVVHNNTIHNVTEISGSASSRAKGISVSGPFDRVTLSDNSITKVEAGKIARAITLTENPPVSGSDIDDDGTDERVGPRNFTIQGNDVDTLDATYPGALWVGGYEDLGSAHVVTMNNFLEGAVERYAGDQTGYDVGDGDNVTMSYNFWNATDGPSGDANGSGVPVETVDRSVEKVDYGPIQSSPFDVFFDVSVAITSGDVIVGEPTTFSVEVHNDRSRTFTEVVEVRVEGATVDTRAVTLAGGETTTFTVEYTPQEVGELRLSALSNDTTDSETVTVADATTPAPTATETETAIEIGTETATETESGGTTATETEPAGTATDAPGTATESVETASPTEGETPTGTESPTPTGTDETGTDDETPTSSATPGFGLVVAALALLGVALLAVRRE